MTYRTLTVSFGHRARPVAQVMFDRPKKKNAISYDMYKELIAALHAIGAHPHSNALVLTGAGDYYSAGNDLSNFARLEHPKTMAAGAKVVCYDFVDAFVSFPKPIVAAVNGPAIGIPVTTLGLCDVRLCHRSATFHTPFKALGQAPEGCSSFMFPRLLGPELSKKMLDDGKIMTATEAKAAGFVEEVYDGRGELLVAAHGVADDIVSGKLKQPRFTTTEPDLLKKLRETNQHEVDVLEKAWVSKECFTALATYLQPRAPPLAVGLRALNATRALWDR